MCGGNIQILEGKGLRFGEAFEYIRLVDGAGMRRPSWKPDVLIKVQHPDEHNKMTAPYLYAESRYGRVPWKETMVELFAVDWEITE